MEYNRGGNWRYGKGNNEKRIDQCEILDILRGPSPKLTIF